MFKAQTNQSLGKISKQIRRCRQLDVLKVLFWPVQLIIFLDRGDTKFWNKLVAEVINSRINCMQAENKVWPKFNYWNYITRGIFPGNPYPSPLEFSFKIQFSSHYFHGEPNKGFGFARLALKFLFLAHDWACKARSSMWTHSRSNCDCIFSLLEKVNILVVGLDTLCLKIKALCF